VAHNLAIKRIAGDGDPIRPQNILSRMAPAPHARSHMHEREVAGATAKVGDQDQFIVVELALELIRRRHWFEFEHNVFKPRLFEGCPQAA
jgi:hypothetical protein